MSELPEPQSLAQMAEAAGKKTILPPGADPDIDALRDHIMGFLNNELVQNHGAMMAKTKAQELIFWVRSSRHTTRPDL